MRRNCSIAIAVWVALFAGYAFYFSRSDLPLEGALLGGAIMSFTVGLGIAMLNGARYASRDRRALDRFRRGERPQDGEFAAVTGEIRATFDPLRAPFSGRECVAYRYDIGPRRRRDHDVARDYVGFAFARCAIHSSWGAYALGTVPVLNNFPEQRAQSAQEFVDATQFEEFSNVLAFAKYTLELYQQSPPLRVDWRIGQPSGDVSEAKEMVVASGTTVTAYGRYSSAIHGLTSGAKDEGYLRLYPGSTSPVPASAIGQIIGGIALIVVANFGMWIVLENFATR